MDQMVPTDRIGGVAGSELDSWRKLHDDLRGLAQRLRTGVDAYQECPGKLDEYLLEGVGHSLGVETIMTEIYRLVKRRVYDEDSWLRADDEVWEALNDQKDEFASFYKAALRALETYREVLQAYRLIIGGRSRPRRGDLECIRKDKRAHVEERDLCIEAFSDFHDKFAGMLTIL